MSATPPTEPRPSRRIVVLVMDDFDAAEDLQTVLHSAIKPPWKPVPAGVNTRTYKQERWGQEETDAFILERLKRAAPRIHWQSATILPPPPAPREEA